MKASLKPRLPQLLCSAILASGLAIAAGPAAAAVTDGDALGICKQKVKETFGEKASASLKRIKTRKTYTVEVKVSGVADKPFTATCEVTRDGALASFTHEGPAK